jgi:methionyl-tRNA synthetase
VDPALGADFEGLLGKVRALIDRTELTEALEEIWERVRRLNQYVEQTRPWDLAKEDGGGERLDTVLYNLAEGLRVTTLLLYPYMPETAGRLLDVLAEEGRELTEVGSRRGGQRVEKLPPLFPKLEMLPGTAR